MKLSDEDKREIIRLKEEGKSAKSIAILYGLNIDTVKRMIRSYRIHGEEALTKTSKRKFSTDLKYEVITRNLDGYNGLIDKKKGRPPKMKIENDDTAQSFDEIKDDGTDKARIKLLEKKNRELETEVAYLKKLNALVQERKKRESKKK